MQLVHCHVALQPVDDGSDRLPVPVHGIYAIDCSFGCEPTADEVSYEIPDHLSTMVLVFDTASLCSREKTRSFPIANSSQPLYP